MMQHRLSVLLVLSLIWLMNSGHYSALLLSLGLLSVCFAVWIAERMDVIDHESQPIHLTARVPSYWLWLAKNILLSNIDVVIRIWRGPKAISPCLATLPAEQASDMGKVIYANSINLTPGTLAIELEDGHVLVHALTEQSMADLQQGEMARRSCDLEPKC